VHKIAFYADTFYDSPRSPAYWIPPAHLDVEAILLGGDIHYRPQYLGDMLREIRASQHDDTVLVVVPGNGEYVSQELGQARRQYRSAVAAVPNALFLDNDTAVLPTGLRIIGSTLWSHVPEHELAAYTRMGIGDDHIRLGERPMTLEDNNELHRQARSFLEEQLRSLTPAERDETIVCTHHWPTLGPLREPGGQPLSYLYIAGSDLDALIADCGPRYWLCGHEHVTHHVTIGATRISSNPRAGDGPDHVNPAFEEHFVVAF
jgi:hypothetical protein